MEVALAETWMETHYHLVVAAQTLSVQPFWYQLVSVLYSTITNLKLRDNMVYWYVTECDIWNR